MWLIIAWSDSFSDINTRWVDDFSVQSISAVEVKKFTNPWQKKWYLEFSNLWLPNNAPAETPYAFENIDEWNETLGYLDGVMFRISYLMAHEKATWEVFTKIVPPMVEHDKEMPLDVVGATFAECGGRPFLLDDELDFVQDLVDAWVNVPSLHLQSALSKWTSWSPCPYDEAQSIADIVRYVKEANKRFPDIDIYLIDALFAKGLNYQSSFTALQSALSAEWLSIKGMVADVPMEFMEWPTATQTWTWLKQHEQYTRSIWRDFWLVLVSKDATSNQMFYDRSLLAYDRYKSVWGDPDITVSMSRFSYPDILLEETTPYSHMNTARDLGRVWCQDNGCEEVMEVGPLFTCDSIQTYFQTSNVGSATTLIWDYHEVLKNPDQWSYVLERLDGYVVRPADLRENWTSLGWLDDYQVQNLIALANQYWFDIVFNNTGHLVANDVCWRLNLRQIEKEAINRLKNAGFPEDRIVIEMQSFISKWRWIEDTIATCWNYYDTGRIEKRTTEVTEYMEFMLAEFPQIRFGWNESWPILGHPYEQIMIALHNKLTTAWINTKFEHYSVDNYGFAKENMNGFSWDKAKSVHQLVQWFGWKSGGIFTHKRWGESSNQAFYDGLMWMYTQAVDSWFQPENVKSFSWFPHPDITLTEDTQYSHLNATKSLFQEIESYHWCSLKNEGYEVIIEWCNWADQDSDGICDTQDVCPNVVHSTSTGWPLDMWQACTSEVNACGESNQWTIQCDGSCSALAPTLDTSYNSACTSEINNWWASNSWVITCEGVCSVSAPEDEDLGWSCITDQNNCWEVNSWVIQCGWICSVTTPPDDNKLVWTTCTSAANNCWITNQWTYTCDGVCDATVPDDQISCTCSNPPSNFGDVCTSNENICWETSIGIILCDGSCSASIPELSQEYNTTCISSANNCWDTNTWVITCDGTCSVPAPNDELLGWSCSTWVNNCGESNLWTIQCGWVCSVTSAPDDNRQVWTICTTAANNCWTTNQWTYTCDGQCDASIPADLEFCWCPNAPSNYWEACTGWTNACWEFSSWTIQCDWSCSAGIPDLHPLYETACESAANNCWETQSWTINCNWICEAETPDDELIWVACSTQANNCGVVNTWVLQCGWICSVTSPPADNDNVWSVCYSEANNCWEITQWTLECTGECTAQAPSNVSDCSCSNPPSDYGVACESEANICWETTIGKIQCDWWCSATVPSESDEDSDGIIDCKDSCLWFDNDLIGTACDDGLGTTNNDRYSASCLCVWKRIVVMPDPELTPDPAPKPDPVVKPNDWSSRNNTFRWTWWDNFCGDGNLLESSGEQCDDGNNISWDGCSSNCEIELGNRIVLEESLISYRSQAKETTREVLKEYNQRNGRTIASTNYTVVDWVTLTRDISYYLTKLKSLQSSFSTLRFFADGTMNYIDFLNVSLYGKDAHEQIEFIRNTVVKLEAADEAWYIDMNVSKQATIQILEAIAKKVEQDID